MVVGQVELPKNIGPLQSAHTPNRARQLTRLAHYCAPTWTGFTPAHIAQIRVPATPFLALAGGAMGGSAAAFAVVVVAETIGSARKIVAYSKLSALQKQNTPKGTLISRAIGMGMLISGSLVEVANALIGGAINTPLIRASAALILIGLITLAVDKVVRMIKARLVLAELKRSGG